jgi:uncharacterized protein YecE (DUF72 family)
MVEPLLVAGHKVWIGCSGYVYKHWRGAFYPQDLPASRWLQYYAHYFPTVELNNTHYILPAASTFENWREGSPEGFVFAVKASRFLTHMKKLKDPQQPLQRLFERATLLGPKLGPVLYQLPPRWQFDAQRLETFLQALPRVPIDNGQCQHAIEVREPGWLNPEFFALLERYSVAFCIASLPQYETPLRATAPFVYIRFHGSGQMYYYKYTEDELHSWRDVIVRFAEEGRTVYAYFNNDPEAWAVEDALQLMGLVNNA